MERSPESYQRWRKNLGMFNFLINTIPLNEHLTTLPYILRSHLYLFGIDTFGTHADYPGTQISSVN